MLNRARAIENGAFVVSACAVGTVEGGGEAYGHSLIINPWGEIVADAGAQRGVVHATIDLDDVAVARGKINVLPKSYLNIKASFEYALSRKVSKYCVRKPGPGFR